MQPLNPSDLDRASCVFDFVEQYLRDARAGRSRSLPEYQARFPGHEGDIEQEWRTLQQSVTPAPTPGTQGLPEVPGFRLLRELGVGG